MIEQKVAAAKDIVMGLRAGDTKPTWKKCFEFETIKQGAKEEGAPKPYQK